MRSGFSPVATKLLQLGVAAGRQQICETVKLSEGCNIFPGKNKNKKIVHVEEVINQNVWICHYLLITCCSASRQDSHTFPTSSDRQWKRAAFQRFIGLECFYCHCSTSCIDNSRVALKALTDSTVQRHNPAGIKITQLVLPNCTYCPLLL